MITPVISHNEEDGPLVITTRDQISLIVVEAVEHALQRFAPPDQDAKKRFSQRQASHRYGISEVTLIKWRKQGKLHADVVNGRVFYTEADMEKAFTKSAK